MTDSERNQRAQRIVYEVYPDTGWQAPGTRFDWFEIALYAELSEYVPPEHEQTREAFSALMDAAEGLIQRLPAPSRCAVELSGSYYMLHSPECGDFAGTRLWPAISLVFTQVQPYQALDESGLLPTLRAQLAHLNIFQARSGSPGGKHIIEEGAFHLTQSSSGSTVGADLVGAIVVGVIMGSKSDWETMRHAADMLKQFDVSHECRIVSAHRTPEQMAEYASSAAGRGLEVIIAGAGGAAHLPGMVAAHTVLPVLGVPVESKALNGMDSLLSIAQMPAGVPVGTLAIGKAGAINAALLGIAILANSRPPLREQLLSFRRKQTDRVRQESL